MHPGEFAFLLAPSPRYPEHVLLAAKDVPHRVPGVQSLTVELFGSG
ncbi:MAG: hypothetical protein AB8G77_24360 [Rhodothermales bacterium]